MKPKDAAIDIYNTLIRVEPTTILVNDSTLPYTPFICFEKNLNDFATVTFRIHVNKKHNYLKIENNLFIRIHSFDKLYSVLNDDYIKEIGKIFFHSFSYFNTYINQSLVSDIEINDENNEKVKQKIQHYTNSFINDYENIYSYLTKTFTEDFIKNIFINSNDLAYVNGKTYKLICPSITNSKVIELAGFHTYNKQHLKEALTILKGLTSKKIDEIARSSYNKLVHKICELNNLDFNLYKSTENPALYFQSKIKRSIYLLLNKNKNKKGVTN